jgi:hypothetical protein
MNLDEILERFNSKPEAEKAEIKKIVEKAREGLKWIPNPGPQTEAYFSKADVLLYGGAGGGGKTDLEIGLAINNHKRSLIMRRKYTDLSFITDRTIQILGNRKGFNGSAPPKFNLPGGGLIEYGAANNAGDELDWMGRPHDLLCLEKGTKILLPNGNYCQIEDLKIGDLVQTLEGPKPVERIFDKGVDEALLATAYCDKVPLFQQVQGLTHSLLTTEGWASHDNETGTPPFLNDGPLSTLSHAAYTGGLLFQSLFQEFWRLLFQRHSDRKRILKYFRSFYRLSRWGFFFFLSSILRGTGYGSFEHRLAIFERQLLKCVLREHQELDLYPTSPLLVNELDAHGVYDVPIKTSLEDYQDGYLFSSRQDDEHAHLGLKDGLFYLPQLNDAGQQNPTCFADDVLDKIQKHIVHKESYAHPYTKERRPIDIDFASLSLSFAPVGKRHLYDITVKDVNHYISYNGFVNKNCIDEATHFAGSQIRALMGWVRSTDPEQRVRVVLGSNPPLSDEGLWVFGMFAPWLDPEYPDPAEDGELRWCCVGDNDQDIWVDGPGEHVIDGKTVRALSRTFIRARLQDNPFQDTAEYRAQLDGLPMYMRDAIRDGNFLSVRKDHRFQLIPTAWIKAAMDRWTVQPPENIPMCVVAADMTGLTDEMQETKPDKFTIASRHDGYYNEIEVFNAADKNSGAEKAAAILKHRRDGAQIILDMGGGYGDATYEHLTNNGEKVLKYKGAESSGKRTKKSKIQYANKRADAYYSFYEDLDPDQPGGSRIALPPNKLLMADLCSIRFDPGNEDSKIIKLESKKDLRKRHGRSTDYSDPVVMAWSVGDKQDSHYHEWHKRGRAPRVITRKP